MGTIVLLAGFLLAASANPIANSGTNRIEEASDTHSGDVSSTDDHSQSSNHDHTINDDGDHETSNDHSPHSTEDDNGASDSEVQDKSHDESADDTVENTDNDTGDEHPSSVSNDSTTSTKVSSEDNTSNHGDDEATSVNSSDSTDSEEPSTGGNTTNRTEDATTSSDTSVSTTPAKTETSTQQSSDMVPTPSDADPRDCKNATERNHTYELCTYSCQGDEMFTAPDNSSCYLHPGNMTAEVDIIGEYGPTEHNTNETGICYRGDCVRSLTEATAAPTESSTAGTSMQQGNESYTTPPDADPKDCRNASEKNHTYELCTYSCQGDEMFTAPDNSSCYLHPANVTEILTGNTEHSTNETGVCFKGSCVRRSTVAPAASTESSPGTTTTTTTTTTAETGGETGSPINEEASGMTAKPNAASEPVSASSPQDKPTDNNGSPEKPLTDVGSSEVENVSSTGSKGPVALPGALSQDTHTENNSSLEKPLGSPQVEEASSTQTNGPIALPGGLPAMP